MARENRMQQSNTNPAERFLEWKSKEQKFSYWDREKEENVLVDLPIKILALVAYKTVTGFNQKYRGGGPKGTAIRANEVKDIKDTLKVFYMDPDKTVIAEGPWNQIKDEVDGKDGKYTLSVYAMTPSGQLVNLKLSGAAVGSWFEFCKNQTDKFFDHWVEVKEAKEGQQGSVVYHYPVFSWGAKIDRKAEKLAEAADEKVKAYEVAYFGGSSPTNISNHYDSAARAYEQANGIAVNEPETVGVDEPGKDPLDF